MLKNLPLTLESCLKWFCDGAAACYDANLGAQPGGLAGNYSHSQQPTTIVSVFVDGEICHSNPLCGGDGGCGRLDSIFEGFFLKKTQSPNIEQYMNLYCSIVSPWKYPAFRRGKKEINVPYHKFACGQEKHSFFSLGILKKYLLTLATNYWNNSQSHVFFCWSRLKGQCTQDSYYLTLTLLLLPVKTSLALACSESMETLYCLSLNSCLKKVFNWNVVRKLDLIFFCM